MIDAGAGLTLVPTEALRVALRCLHRGDLRCPVDLPELTRCGLQYVAAELMHNLRGLDAPAVRAVLVAVLAERKVAADRNEVERRKADIVLAAAHDDPERETPEREGATFLDP